MAAGFQLKACLFWVDLRLFTCNATALSIFSRKVGNGAEAVVVVSLIN